MKSRWMEHGLSVFAVALLMVAAGFFLKPQKPSGDSTAAEYPRVNLSDPFERALLREALDLYRPGQSDKNRAAVEAAASAQERKLTERLSSSGVRERLSFDSAGRVLLMYLNFLIVYAAVLALTYYGVQTLGLWQFVMERRALNPSTTEPAWQQRVKKAGGIAGFFVLFSPAYVIAYSLRTDFNTDSLLLMVILGVISNGALAAYANKFRQLLTTEARKGYVDTARAKNLNEDFFSISPRALLKPRKRFEGHLLHAIFDNARHQYLPTLKEQGAFLVTSLVIIEMALNIHGHFSYEMLRQLLYQNYSLVLFFFFLTFLTVKLTDLLTDHLSAREARKFGNDA